MPEPKVTIHRQISLLAALLLAGTAHIANAQNPDLTYHPVTPCTVVDTRPSNPFAAGEIRTYNVVGSASLASQGGSATGCGIPGFSNGIAQVQAVALVVTAITPAGGGNIAAHAADQPLAGSVLNLVAGTTPTNTTPVAVAQTTGVGDIKVQVSFSSTHVLIRAVGYYSKDVQTVHVHPVPGDHTASGTALLTALAGITNASATKRYVIKLEPGIFDLGSTRLIMKPYVDIEGSGQEASVIQGGAGEQSDGVIWGASFTELRQLQVKSTGTSASQFAIPVFLQEGAAMRLTSVTLAGSGAGANYGLRAAGGSPWIEEATIRVQGGEIGYGIVARGTSHLTVKRTLIEVTSSSFESDGILLASTEHEAEIRDVQITAASSGASYGIRLIESSVGGLRLTSSTINAEDYGIGNLTGGPIFIENSQVRATASGGYGVQASSATVTVDHSEIAGEASTVVAANTWIGATRLQGGAVALLGTATCAFVYDESFAPFAGPACP
jgi:hypothetical protein